MKSDYRIFYAAALLIAGMSLSLRLSAQSPQTEPASEMEEPVVAASTAEWHGAHIEFAENVHDFGDVSRRGGDVGKDFEFVNNGTEPLVVTGVTVSCTCIKAHWSKRPVAVGETGTVRLVYEPHKMEAGTFYKVVEVHSNSVGGDCLLTVHGNAVDVRRGR